MVQDKSTATPWPSEFQRTINRIERTYWDNMYLMKNRKLAFYIFCLKFIMYRGYTRKKSKIPISAEREWEGEHFRLS